MDPNDNVNNAAPMRLLIPALTVFALCRLLPWTLAVQEAADKAIVIQPPVSLVKEKPDALALLLPGYGLQWNDYAGLVE